jgi:hypothetical protein
MPDDCKDKLRIEAYKQCFIAKHHYDILSWSIAGGSLVFVGLIIATILQVSLSTYWTTVRLVLAILAIVVIRVWHSIYRRNSFWGEVANETTRDIEREAGISGPGIAFMKGGLDKKIILKNTDENKNKYKNNEPLPILCSSKPMHESIKYLIWCLILLTLIAVFIPSRFLNRSKSDLVTPAEPAEIQTPAKENIQLK